MTSPIKVAVIGVGALGEHHARIYAEAPGAELTAVVDSKPERAREIAARYGCRALTDCREALESAQAVSLAVPTALHAEIGVECLNRGVHVLVEKPMADSLVGADALMDAAEGSGAVLHVGHSERFNPAVSALRPYLKEPRFFEAHRLGVFVPRSLDVDVVLDLMIHDLDLILHWVDSPIRDIRAVGVPILTSRVDIANARLEFENGCVANITASRVSNEKIRKLRFFQLHDYVSINFQEQTVQMYSLERSGPRRLILRRRLEIQREEPLKREIGAFLGAVRGESPQDGPQGCSAGEGKRALETALEVLKEMATATDTGC